MQPYVVRQGDYLAQIAHRRGFSAEEVWNHPLNAELRERRGSHDILHPGDILQVPVGREGWSPRPLSSGGEHHFTARVTTIEIKLVLHRADRTVIANAPFRVDGLGPQPFEGETDGAGLALFEVPVHVREVAVSLAGEGLDYRVRIGRLDPAGEPSGVAKRLAHLGYLAPIGHDETPCPEALVSDAVSAFQEAQGLAVTGTVDDATRDALVAAHGS